MTTDPVNWGGARRRLDAVFGDLLPSVTSDELAVDELAVDEPERNAAPDHGSGGGGAAGHGAEDDDSSSSDHETLSRESARDAELLANRPPHHDRD